MNDDQRKHLEFLQTAITRMGQNSFAIKGWAITIVSALFALSVTDATKSFALLAVLPAVTLCALDAYFLGLERSLRNQYDNHVRAYASSPACAATYVIRGELTSRGYLRALLRPSVLPVYVLVLVTAEIVWLKWGKP
jgi:hypothetical protein